MVHGGTCALSCSTVKGSAVCPTSLSEADVQTNSKHLKCFGPALGLLWACFGCLPTFAFLCFSFLKTMVPRIPRTSHLHSSFITPASHVATHAEKHENNLEQKQPVGPVSGVTGSGNWGKFSAKCFQNNGSGSIWIDSFIFLCPPMSSQFLPSTILNTHFQCIFLHACTTGET